jgi:hypothetical protein
MKWVLAHLDRLQPGIKAQIQAQAAAWWESTSTPRGNSLGLLFGIH